MLSYKVSAREGAKPRSSLWMGCEAPGAGDELPVATLWASFLEVLHTFTFTEAEMLGTSSSS